MSEELSSNVKMPVHEMLRSGKENAVPSKLLAQSLGYESVRDLQKQIERERLAGAVILPDNHGAGYYLSNDPAELREFTKTMEARSRNTSKTAESARRALDALTGQERIGGW